MTRATIALPLVLSLAACGRPLRHDVAETPTRTIAPSPPQGVAFLAGHPEILADVHRRCKARAPSATPDLCAEAAEATRLRFTSPAGGYAPAPVQPFADEASRP